MACSSESARGKFERLLGEARIRPKKEVMQKLQGLRPEAILTAGTPYEAVEWYEWAKSYPATSTRGVFKGVTGYVLNGPHGHLRGLMIAYSPEGGAMMMKLLPSRTAEVDAIEIIGRHSHIAASTFVHATAEGKDICGLLMPKYERSLLDSDLRLENDVLLSRAKDLIGALNHVHQCDRVHMDVKLGNVFVDAAGQWYLGDFGSCVAYGALIVSTTRACYPDDIVGKPAEYRHDWYMLAVLLAGQLGAVLGLGADLDESVRSAATSGCGDELQALILRLMCAEERTLVLGRE